MFLDDAGEDAADLPTIDQPRQALETLAAVASEAAAPQAAEQSVPAAAPISTPASGAPGPDSLRQMLLARQVVELFCINDFH